MTPCMNPKTLYTLRLAAGPVPRDHLTLHYDGPDGLEQDLAALRRHALVCVTEDRVCWVGS